MKYKHVVFDLDGTLLDSDRSLFLAWRDTFRQFGKYCSDEEIYASFGKTRWDIFGMFGVDKPDEFWEAWKKNYKRLSADVGFFDGVNDLLGKLKERGIKTGLVTSRAREELDAYFSDLLKGVFDYEVCADDTKKHKPDPEPLLYYAARAGIEPKDCVYIGDMPTDVRCANAAGADSAIIVWKKEREEAAQQAGAKYIFHSLKEISEAVE